MCSKPIFCSKIALKGKTCSRLLKPQKVAPNAKSCSKVAEKQGKIGSSIQSINVLKPEPADPRHVCQHFQLLRDSVRDFNVEIES